MSKRGRNQGKLGSGKPAQQEQPQDSVELQLQPSSVYARRQAPFPPPEELNQLDPETRAAVVRTSEDRVKAVSANEHFEIEERWRTERHAIDQTEKTKRRTSFWASASMFALAALAGAVFLIGAELGHPDPAAVVASVIAAGPSAFGIIRVYLKVREALAQAIREEKEKG